MEKRYDVMLHPRSFARKPTPAETGLVKNQIADCPASLTAEQMAEACVSGRCISFCHAERQGRAFTKADWKYQQAYALDFDNAGPGKKKLEKPYYMTCEEAWEHASRSGLRPAFLYTTSSHADEWHRFRMVFLLDEPVASVLEHAKVIRALFSAMSVEGRIVVDQSCKDVSRIFYSGRQLLFRDFSAVESKAELLKRKIDVPAKDRCKTVSGNHPSETNASDATEAVRQIIEEVEAVRKQGRMTMKSPQSLMNAGSGGDGANSEHRINNDSVFTQRQIGAKPCCITVSEDFYAFCYDIDLAELLDVPQGKKFSCVLPDHEDGTPSAEISFHEGKYIYHCFGCDTHLDIFGLVEHLTGCSHYTVKEWIARRFHVIYETAWQRMHKEAMLSYQDYLLTGDFKEKFPVLYKALVKGSHSAVLNMILHLARMHVMDEAASGVDKPVFYMTKRNLLQKSKHFGIAKSMTALHNSITFLAHLGLIKVLQDGELPPKLHMLLRRIQKGSEAEYRISCYQIPDLTYELLHHAEEMLALDKQNCVRRKYFCREELVRAFGADEAMKCYVQSGNKGLSPIIELFYKRYVSAAEKLLGKKGWTTEQEILNRIKGECKVNGRPSFMSKADKVKWSNICMPQLLQELGLVRVSFTKKLESELSIRSRKKLAYGASKVIVKAP